MKNKVLYILAISVFFMLSCSEQEPAEVSAEFTTNIVNNTLEVKQNFTIYLDQAKGEYFTYFKGDAPTNVFDPNSFNAKGIAVEEGVDSVLITSYRIPGEYQFTLVATSWGNYGEDFNQEYKSIDITVTEAQ